MDGETTQVSATVLQLLGAGGFGAIIGFLVYQINRHRTGDVQFSDLVTIIGIIGGTAILQLFPQATDLFGAYGIGLFIGFFGYLIMLMIMVSRTDNFSVDWFLDGRFKTPKKSEQVDQRRAMDDKTPDAEKGD
ncbi:MAG: hypothetical protein H6662_17215 [Ardenticatenaceae bacterium]|nr:hypothetical protein [Anaerolineales bacterium]MCB8923330.1 hypothetical protein [Ardenticatenaceae bacterium]MCB9004670.1 hypothetical protein [Ardenticatenaceae bacterium]